MTETTDQDQARRVADLHDSLEDASARLYGVYAFQAWKDRLNYPDWDAYAAAEILPRLLKGLGYTLLRPGLDRYRSQHTGSHPDQEVHTLLDQAGRLLLATRPATLTRWHKAASFGDPAPPGEVVTGADIAVRDLIIGGLREVLGPDIGIFAEEGHTALGALEEPVCVVLDPLDQPRALLAGRVEYSVNLAVINHGHLSAWCDFPALGWRFHTTIQGLWFNGRPLQLATPWPGPLTVAVDPDHARLLPARLPDGRAVLPHVGGGVAYRLALLALGLVQAVWIPPTPAPRLRLWEVLPMAAALPHLGMHARGFREPIDLAQQRPAVWAGGLLAASDKTSKELRTVLSEPDQGPAQ